MAETSGLDIPSLTPLVGGPSARYSSEPSDEVSKLLQLIVGQQFPQRLGGLFDVLNQFQARAAGSPQAIEGLANPQLAQMAQEILQTTHQASRAFGPYGGAQIGQALGQARGQQPMLATFVNPTVKAGQDLASYMRGISLIAPSNAQNQSGTRSTPDDPAAMVNQLAKIFGQGKDVYNRFWGPQTTSPTFGSSPATSTPMSMPDWGGMPVSEQFGGTTPYYAQQSPFGGASYT